MKTPTGQARARARRLYTGKQFRDLYVQGFLARRSGKSETACPYAREPRRAQTWNSRRRTAWLRGWQSGAG